jgi:hypothetical protein
MSTQLWPIPKFDDPLEMATGQVIAACDGDVRAAVRALIVAKGLVEAERSEPYAATSKASARSRMNGRRECCEDDDLCAALVGVGNGEIPVGGRRR